MSLQNIHDTFAGLTGPADAAKLRALLSDANPRELSDPIVRVPLSSTPAADSTFTGWSGDCTGTSTCTVLMIQARSVTANFTLAPATPVDETRPAFSSAPGLPVPVAETRPVFSPAPGITVGETRGAVTLAASVRAACRDLVRGANFWVRSTSKVTCLKSSMPAALSLRNGLVQAATPDTYPIRVRINRANGTQVTRAITVTVR